MNKIPYSNDFKQRILNVLPNSHALTTALENDEEIVGRILDDCAQDIPAETVLSMIENNQITELKQKASNAITIRNLFKEWQDTYKQNFT